MHRRTKLPVRLGLTLLALAFGAAVLAKGPPTAPEAVTEANITRLTASILGNSQLAHKPIDDALAGAFLDRYLDALDAERLLFLESDVAMFASYRRDLALETLRDGDTHVAHVVFDRLLTRLAQRDAFVNSLLETSTFDFTGDDSYLLERKNAARPRDLAAAQELWRQRLRAQYLQAKLDGKTPDQVKAKLARQMKGMLQIMEQMDREKVLEMYLSALAQVYDPHSDYLGHEQMADFAISMNLSLFGIGAKLQSVDGKCKVVEVLAGGPAMRSGALHAGDSIVAVAQQGGDAVEVEDLPLSHTVSLIRGPKGSVVELTVIPAGDAGLRKTVTLVRDEIKLEDQRAKAKVVDFPVGESAWRRLGIIELPSFYSNLIGKAGNQSADEASATSDVARLLRKLEREKVEGIVLDLRSNGGGSLQEAISLTGLFIARGPVVQTRGPDGDIDVGVDTDASVLYRGPLVVLTSRFSASASEILAGALQDYGRALIVGDPSTFGKGTVQSLVSLGPMMDRAGLPYAYDPGALMVTIRKFYRPGGASTQLRGVVPDIIIPSLTSMSPVGESDLDNPLPWDAVPAADFDPLPDVAPYLETLREESAARVQRGNDFAYLRFELARMKEKLTTRTVSLNEAVRRQERARLAERQKVEKAVLNGRQDRDPVVYEVSMSAAGRPGLPPSTAHRDDLDAGKRPAAVSTETASQGDADEPSPKRDITLEETQRILADYVALRLRSTQARTASPARMN